MAFGGDGLPELRHGSDSAMDDRMTDVTVHTACRVCDSPLTEYLDLGEQPLANAFLRPDDVVLRYEPSGDVGTPEFTAPLKVLLCTSCGLSQLSHTVSPERLYSHYLFTSGVSKGWLEHCDRLAQEYTRDHGSGFVIDIASNDGTMLRPFQKRGHRVLGIEPAQNIATNGVPTLPMFWNSASARHVVGTVGQANLIIATNVLGHVDHVVDFLDGIRIALDKWGFAIIECPHIMPLLFMNAFDTIYHEHLSYWSLNPLRQAAKRAGLWVYDCKPQSVHGGTMRYFLCHSKNAHLTDNLAGLWKREQEAGLKTLAPYREFAANVEAAKPRLQEALAREGVWGFGASAKGNTLLNYVGATLPGIFDDTPQKQGLLTPGRHIPVQPLPADLGDIPALALLSWNWERELKQKACSRGFRGDFLTPMPRAEWSRA